MNSLPFVQPPAAPKTKRCGNAQSGILEFPVLGGLTVGESKTISKLVGNANAVLMASAKVANRIADAEGITLSEAFNLVESTLNGQALEGKAETAASRNKKDIDELRLLCVEQAETSRRALVVALVRSRLNLPDWSGVDEMHNVLFNEIADFGLEEQNAEEAEPAEPQTEESLKKRPKASRNAKRSTTSASVGS